MSAIASELQTYALQPISYEKIPAKLNEIIAYQNRKQSMSELYGSLSGNVRKVLDKLPTEQEYRVALNTAKEHRMQADAFPGGLEAIWALSSNAEAEKAFADYQVKYHKAF